MPAAKCCGVTAAKASGVVVARRTLTPTASTWCSRLCARALRPRRVAESLFYAGKRPRLRSMKPQLLNTVSTNQFRKFAILYRYILIFWFFFLSLSLSPLSICLCTPISLSLSSLNTIDPLKWIELIHRIFQKLKEKFAQYILFAYIFTKRKVNWETKIKREMADPESNSWKRIFQRNEYSKFVYTFFFSRTLLFRNLFRNVELNCIDRVQVKMSEEESVSFEKRVSID